MRGSCFVRWFTNRKMWRKSHSPQALHSSSYMCVLREKKILLSIIWTTALTILFSWSSSNHLQSTSDPKATQMVEMDTATPLKIIIVNVWRLQVKIIYWTCKKRKRQNMNKSVLGGHLDNHRIKIAGWRKPSKKWSWQKKDIFWNSNKRVNYACELRSWMTVPRSMGW